MKLTDLVDVFKTLQESLRSSTMIGDNMSVLYALNGLLCDSIAQTRAQLAKEGRAVQSRGGADPDKELEMVMFDRELSCLLSRFGDKFGGFVREVPTKCTGGGTRPVYRAVSARACRFRVEFQPVSREKLRAL